MSSLSHTRYKEKIGSESSLHRVDISPEALALFCKATKIRETVEVPPTYYTTFRLGEFELFQKFEISLSSILHAEQEYTYERPLHAGDRVQYITRLEHVLEKKTPHAAMHFLSLVTEVRLERESHTLPCGTSKTTIVIKEVTLDPGQ